MGPNGLPGAVPSVLSLGSLTFAAAPAMMGVPVDGTRDVAVSTTSATIPRLLSSPPPRPPPPTTCRVTPSSAPVPVGEERARLVVAMALERRGGEAPSRCPGVGGGVRRGEFRQHVAAWRLGIELRHRGDGQRASYLARGVAPHPVRHREQAG